VSLILGEGLDERDQIANGMQRRGWLRFIEKKDLRRERVHVAAPECIDCLRLIPTEMLEDEIVSVPIAFGNCPNRFEILDLLETRRDARRAITGSRRMAWHRSLRACSKREADNTAQHNNDVLHVRFSSQNRLVRYDAFGRARQ